MIGRTDSTHYNDIAEAIRRHSDEQKQYRPEEMSTGIDEACENVATTNYGVGYNAAKTEWWGWYEGGSSNYMEYRFAGRGWNRNTFQPNTDMSPLQCNGMFQQFDASNAVESAYAKIDTILNNRGVTLDFSKVENMHTTFTGARFESIGKIDGSSCIAWYMTFNGCKIKTIDEIVFNENATFNNTFTNATELTNINKVNGAIGNNVSFASCTKLTLESAVRITRATKDLYGTGKNCVLTFPSNVVTMLENAGAIFPVSDYDENSSAYTDWATYLTDKGWNM